MQTRPIFTSIAPTMSFALALGFSAIIAAATQNDGRQRDDRRGGSSRDWDRGGNHQSRDRNWDRQHNWRRGQTVVDYPDYSAWHLSGGLYPVSQYSSDRTSSVPWRRQRASFFAHASINLGGHNYMRATVTRNGNQYYSFRVGGRS
jgi:hypothetical protein